MRNCPNCRQKVISLKSLSKVSIDNPTVCEECKCKIAKYTIIDSFGLAAGATFGPLFLLMYFEFGFVKVILALTSLISIFWFLCKVEEKNIQLYPVSQMSVWTQRFISISMWVAGLCTAQLVFYWYAIHRT